MFGPKHVWGLDIGRFGLKAVKVAKAGDQLDVLAAEMFEYDWGTVGEDLGGEAVLGAIQQFMAKYPLTKKDRVYVAMPGQSVFSRFINLPPVEKKRVPEIVKYEARQQIPFSIDEVIWGYQPVKEEQLPGEEIEIGLFAIKSEIVLDFLANLSGMQMNLYGLQIAPLALYNFVRYDLQPQEPTVVVDVGAENTDLVILDGEKFWTRNLPVAANDITKAIRDKFDISFEEAENVKRMAAQSKHARQVFEVMEPVLRDLVSEVQRTIGYYKSLAKEVKFSQVVVLGNAFKLPGMEKFMADNLQYDVKALTSTRTLTFGGTVSEAEFSDNLLTFAPALGLTVQGLGLSHIKIDLLPGRFEQSREIRQKKPLAAAAAACFLLAVACGFIREKGRQGTLEKYREQGHTIVKKAETLDRDYKSAMGRVQAAKDPAQSLAGVGRLPELGYERHFWFDFFSAFFDEKKGCVPKEVCLSLFAMQKPGARRVGPWQKMMKGSAGGGGDRLFVVLQGTCTKADTPDEYVNRRVFERIKAFKPIETLKGPVTREVTYLDDTPEPVNIELEGGETVPGVRFVIRFELKTLEEAMEDEGSKEGDEESDDPGDGFGT